MAMAHGTSHLQVNYSNHMNWLSSSNQIWAMCEWKCKNVSIAGGCNCYCCWCTIFLPLIVFTATISHSAFLRVDLVRRALYTMPNSPAIVTINTFIITIVFTVPTPFLSITLQYVQPTRNLRTVTVCSKHATFCYLVQQSQAGEDYLCGKSFLQESSVDTL